MSNQTARDLVALSDKNGSIYNDKAGVYLEYSFAYMTPENFKLATLEEFQILVEKMKILLIPSQLRCIVSMIKVIPMLWNATGVIP